MRIVSTAAARDQHGFVRDWLDSRRHWPKAEWWFYTEGYTLDEPGLVCRDVADIPGLAEWKARHAHRTFVDWRWDVVRWSNKVFAPIDALYDYDGVGVWMGADCVTYRPIPPGMIEAAVSNDYCAFYLRNELPPECDFWVMNCAHPEHKAFLDFMREFYFTDKVLTLPRHDDCVVWAEALKHFAGRITVNNLSGKHSGASHPQALSDLGRYIDHRKGPRKQSAFSPENEYHREFLRA